MVAGSVVVETAVAMSVVTAARVAAARVAVAGVFTGFLSVNSLKSAHFRADF